MKSVSFIIIIVIICNLISHSHTSKILGIFPSCGYSQFILGGKLMRELASKGHEVTVISAFPTKKPIENYIDVPVDGLANFCKGLDLFSLESQGSVKNIFMFQDITSVLTEHILKNENVKQLLNSNAAFDLVICELFFDYALMAFAHHFKAPLVLLSFQGPNEWSKSLLHHPLPFVYVPFASGYYSYKMDTFSRLKNLFDYLFFDLYNNFVIIPYHDRLLRKYLPNSPPVSEILPKIDLVLHNSHISTSLAVPLLPNMIEIAGFHVDPKPLAADLQKFLDEAVDGVIYFSMGSNLKSGEFSMEIRHAFFDAFSNLKQKVLWKFEDETVEMPKNVRIGKWLPQEDILAHPNVKLFITHSGLASTIETVYFGVPTLSIPIFADQKMNARLSEDRGMGLVLSFRNITKDSLNEALHELLNNPEYTNNAKFRSALMRDQETKPMDKAIFWIEYVLRHKGARHLQVHGVTMPWWQYYAIDLIIIALVFIYVIMFVFQFVIQFVCSVNMNKEKIKYQ